MIDDKRGEFETVAHPVAPRQAGWEYIEDANLIGEARQLGEHVVEKLAAPSVHSGKRELVLAPSDLWLTIHESIGHSTELDRALGYEGSSTFACQRSGHTNSTSLRSPKPCDRLEFGRRAGRHRRDCWTWDREGRRHGDHGAHTSELLVTMQRTQRVVQSCADRRVRRRRAPLLGGNRLRTHAMRLAR